MIEILVIDGERAVHILTKGDSALLSVKHFVTVGAVILLHLAPVNNIQGQALQDGADNLVALVIFIDELTLILRANIKTVIIADNTFFCVVEIALADFTDSHFKFLYVHHELSPPLVLQGAYYG